MAEAFADLVFVDFPNSEKSDVRARVARPSSPHGKAGSAGKNVRYNWNPIEKCAVQLESYRKMCGTTEIL